MFEYEAWKISTETGEDTDAVHSRLMTDHRARLMQFDKDALVDRLIEQEDRIDELEAEAEMSGDVDDDDDLHQDIDDIRRELKRGDVPRALELMDRYFGT